MKAGKNGVTKNTATRILFGSGTYHRGLKYDAQKKTWNYAETCVGATESGGKFEIKPVFAEVTIDGVHVPVKGLTKKKVGETATMEPNMIELTKDIIKAAAIAKDSTSADENYDLIESKPDIEDDDYWENIAFVGKTLEGKNIIVIMDNALCTSGLGVEGKDKSASSSARTFECHAELNDDGEFDTLPWHIYYPKASVAAAAAAE